MSRPTRATAGPIAANRTAAAVVASSRAARDGYGGDLERPHHREWAQLPAPAPRRMSRSRSRSPTARQPALDRADRPAQVPRRLLMGAALEVAEHHRRAVPLGQPLDLLVEEPLQLDVATRRVSRVPAFGRVLFEATAGGRRSPGARRGPKGHLMQPGAERVAHPEPARLLHQDQEGRLERVLGVVRVGQRRRGRPAGPSARAARPGRRRPARRPRPGRSRTAPGAGRRSARGSAPTLKSVRSCRRTAPSFPMATAGALRRTVPHDAPTRVM